MTDLVQALLVHQQLESFLLEQMTEPPLIKLLYCGAAYI